jgi:hypothetical protein
MGTDLFSLFTYCYSLYTDFCIHFLSFCYRVSDIFMSAFQMKLNDYPYFNLAEDRRLCSMGHHCPGFPRVLYDAIIRLGYDGDTPVYRCRLSTAHDMDQCEVSVMIPFDPMELWSGSVIGSEPDTGVKLMAHMALTSLCEDCLTTTAALPIALLPIWNHENPVWQQCLEAVSDLEGPPFHAGMTSLATTATREIERLRHENAILRSGARPPSE